MPVTCPIKRAKRAKKAKNAAFFKKRTTFFPSCVIGVSWSWPSWPDDFRNKRQIGTWNGISNATAWIRLAWHIWIEYYLESWITGWILHFGSTYIRHGKRILTNVTSNFFNLTGSDRIGGKAISVEVQIYDLCRVRLLTSARLHNRNSMP
jgi:hypothetical protein